MSFLILKFKKTILPEGSALLLNGLYFNSYITAKIYCAT